MRYLKRSGLIMLCAGMMTALQGCTIKDAAAVFLVIFALLIPGCGENAVEEAIAQGPSVSSLGSLFIIQELLDCDAFSGCMNLTSAGAPSEATAAYIRDLETRESWGWVIKGKGRNLLAAGQAFGYDWTGSDLMIKFTPGIDNVFDLPPWNWSRVRA